MIDVGICAAYTAFAFFFALHCARYALSALRAVVGHAPTVKRTAPRDVFVVPLRQAREVLRSMVRDAPLRRDA